MYGTFWALVPPLFAIVLALLTKEVYSSLFFGVLIGALFAAGFNPVQTLNLIEIGERHGLSASFFAARGTRTIR